MSERPIGFDFGVKKFQQTMREVHQEITKRIDALEPEEREDLDAEIKGAFTAAVDRLNQEPKIGETRLMAGLKDLCEILTTIGIFGGGGLGVIGGLLRDEQLMKSGIGLSLGGYLSGVGGATVIDLSQRHERGRALREDYQHVIGD